MALYICDECWILLDGDDEPCVKNPNGSGKPCCEECAGEIEEELQLDADFKREREAYYREQADITIRKYK